MMSPATCMSVSALMPHSRGNVAYTWYSGVLPNVRNEAGTVGTTDCRKRYIMPSGGNSLGTSGNGLRIGIHTTIDDSSTSACNAKCTTAYFNATSMVAGTCVNTTTAL